MDWAVSRYFRSLAYSPKTQNERFFLNTVPLKLAGLGESVDFFRVILTSLSALGECAE